MPDWKGLVQARLAPLRLEAAAQASLAEELAQHLEDTYRELRSSGAKENEAYAAAMAELEDVEALRRPARRHRMPAHDPVPAGDARRGNVVGDLARDVRYAVRAMRAAPVFVAVAVLTLGLGIGANTTVFTILNTLILNPMPVREPGGLATVMTTDTATGTSRGQLFPMSHRDLQDYRQRNQVFQSLAGFTSPRMMTLQQSGASERVFAEFVTHDYFATLGLTPAKGRFFIADEDRPGAPAVAVLNYGSWQTRFGAREDIVGAQARINGVVLTIIGVAPPRFIGVNAIFGPDVWIPSAAAETLAPNELRDAMSDRGKALFRGIGRLQRRVTRAQAETNVAGIARALAREFPETHGGHGATVRPLRDAVFGGVSASQFVFGGVALSAVVGLVLLIACSNVANLLLARSSARRQEIAVRLAMGASRPRLVRQLLTESVLLGALSGAIGVALGYAGLQLLFHQLPSAATFASPRLDANVLLFGAAISLLTGLLFGTMPALKISRADVASTLKETSRTAGRSRGRVTIGNALMVGQVALSFVLLVTAALCLRSIARAYRMDPGFESARLALFMTNPGQAGYGRAQTREFYRAARERVASLPGVQSAAWASNLPLWGNPVSGVEIEGRVERSKSDTIRAIATTADPGYFATAGIAIETGRAFTATDGEDAAPVAIVNQKMASDFWPSGALGKRVRLPDERQARVIVGIARNANYTTLGEAPQFCVYVPMDQNYRDAMTLYVRSRRDPREIMAPVQRELRAAAPDNLVSSARTGAEIMDGGLFQARMAVGLLAVFGAIALGLASIGLYGIVAYSVNQRKREIGLRIALGATRTSVVGMVVRQGMSLVGAGVVLGVAMALPAGRVLSGMLYGVSATDPASMAAAAFALLSVALLACSLPAHLATRVDPLEALREA